MWTVYRTGIEKDCVRIMGYQDQTENRMDNPMQTWVLYGDIGIL